MGDLIDNDVIISLVEARPVLWDKTLDTFKDRNLTRDAWREVCCALKNDFEDLEQREKNEFGKEVTKRWGNLRDAFSKSKKKLKECKKSGSGASTIKKYIYADQMQFLNKMFESREVAESLEGRADNNEDEDADNPPEAPQPPKETICENLKPREYKRRRRPDEVELKMIKALEEPTASPHVSFIQGLLPHLNKFDDGEILEFQMGVLETISKINKKRKNTAQPQLLPPQTPICYPNNYPFPQYQSHPTSQMSFSNHFTANNSFQPHQPQTHQFLNSQTHSISNTSSATSPEAYPSASPSPAGSVYSENTFDFS